MERARRAALVASSGASGPGRHVTYARRRRAGTAAAAHGRRDPDGFRHVRADRSITHCSSRRCMQPLRLFVSRACCRGPDRAQLARHTDSRGQCNGRQQAATATCVFHAAVYSNRCAAAAATAEAADPDRGPGPDLDRLLSFAGASTSRRRGHRSQRADGGVQGRW